MKRTILAFACLVALAAPSLTAQEWSFNTGPGATLEVDLDTGGSIEITGEPTNTVKIVARVRGRDADLARVDAKPAGKGVRVHSQFSERRRNTSVSVDLVITVPDRYDLELSTKGGAIEITNVEGSIDGSTMGGELDLQSLRGRLSVTTMGGDVTVANSVVDGKVKTMGGSITFRNVEGDFDGETMGGNVTFDNTNASATTKPVTISTMGGNIAVRKAPFGASVSTMGGNVRVESAGRFVKASTMGGEIEVGEIDGDVDVSTMGGDVDVRVVGKGGDVKIESKGGDIDLTLPAGFSARFDLEVAMTRDGGQGYEIRSDFPVQISQSSDWEYSKGSPRKYVRAKGGSGTHSVSVTTINGDIVIRKAD